MFTILIALGAAILFGVCIGLFVGRMFCDWHHRNDHKS